MALTVTQLADGQLAAAKGTLYTTPASTQTIVRSIILVNTSTSDVTANIYMCPSGGTSRRIGPKDFTILAEGMAILDDVYSLDTGDLIEGDDSSATTVDYTIYGVQNA